MGRVFVCEHPIALCKLSKLRDKSISSRTFRSLVKELVPFLMYEATRDVRIVPVTVQTPLTEASGWQQGERIALFPILRAGAAMDEAARDLFPHAHVYHLGFYRNEETREPVFYYDKIPAKVMADLCLVIDPMLATGGSAVAAIDLLKKKWGNVRIKFIGLLAAPEGVKKLSEAHPDLDIHLVSVDDGLNDDDYIVPGLGDAGDRYFGTC